MSSMSTADLFVYAVKYLCIAKEQARECRGDDLKHFRNEVDILEAEMKNYLDELGGKIINLVSDQKKAIRRLKESEVSDD